MHHRTGTDGARLNLSGIVCWRTVGEVQITRKTHDAVHDLPQAGSWLFIHSLLHLQSLGPAKGQQSVKTKQQSLM